MNLKELKEIIALFEQADISELDVERQGVKIRLKKGAETEPPIRHQPQAQPEAAPLPEEKPAGKNTVEIKSPMVGTFYRSPAPDAAPFLEEGEEVREGQVICIIEAMKLMNEIKSEVSGRIKKMLVENGQPVEFDQPLFLVEIK